ncbi:hypothetical protein HPK19_03330 [Arthrobacter citreus]|nr:hypothetical protein HPK19_03330 [Arthrobacter citreus]
MRGVIMFPLKNYYESIIKKEIVGMKREVALKKLGNMLACQVISKDTKDSVHFRYFPCTMEMKPNVDRWLGTIAVKFKNDIVVDSAISVPKNNTNYSTDNKL